MSHNIEQARHAFAVFSDMVQDFTYDDIVLAYSQLAHGCVHLFRGVLKEWSGFLAWNYRRIFNHIVQFNIKEELEDWFLSFFHGLVEQHKRYTNVDKQTVMVNQVKELVLNNYSDPGLSIDALADRVGVSVNHLRRIFKEATGESLSTYLLDFRFGKVEKLLRETDLTVLTIAEQCGFLPNPYFYTLFKKKFGLTPEQFRLK